MSSGSGISLQNVFDGGESTTDPSRLGEFYIEDGHGGQQMSAPKQVRPAGFVLAGKLAGFATVILLLVTVVVCSTKLRPWGGVSTNTAHSTISVPKGYQQYDQSCWSTFPSNTSMAVKDASCASGLVCARNGHDSRDSGDCPGRHCCSVEAAPEALIRLLAGKWAPAPEDRSAWMTGLKIAEDGSFECSSGRLKDGLVRVLSVPDRLINVKRTCKGANDHVFRVDEDGGRMLGQWPRSPTKITLTKISDSRGGTFSI